MLFSMLLNDNFVDIEKSDGICSLTYLWINFQDYFHIYQYFVLNIKDLMKCSF